jgi:flagellar protein FlgJ
MAGGLNVTSVSVATVPAKTTLSPAQIEKTRKAAEDFEAMALGEMLQPMFKTVDTSKGLFGGGKGEATWKPMMVDEMAKTIAKNGGIGLADSVMREMLRMQEKKHD